MRGDMLFGNTLLLFHAGSGTPDLAPIEAYIHQASIALQRRIAEDAPAQSEVRYRGIVEDQTELIIRYHPDGTITFANDVACRYFQKEKQDLAGSSFPALIPAQERAIFRGRIRSWIRRTRPSPWRPRSTIPPDGSAGSSGRPGLSSMNAGMSRSTRR
ncbi:MAG: PAS domain-containing protein [Bacillus subtilis]|nr:PAS domain-containing protein [Bacillus subtilis]